MKLVSFFNQADTNIRPGLVQHDTVIDIGQAGALLSLAMPTSIQQIIENYATIKLPLQDIATASEQGKLAAASYPLKQVTLVAPIPQPRKNIMCLAVNYSEHAQETAAHREHGGKPPTQPIIFTKAPTTVNAPNGKIVIDPAVSSEMDWEVELGVIIGTAGKNIHETDAMQHVFGYTILNDVTARDLQSRHKQFFKGKSLDGSCPIGPWIVTADEISDPHHLSLQLRVNGTIKQSGNTRQMIFSIPDMIAVLSQGMTLEAGDIIATGTPSGVGFTRQPPEFLKPGDIMESEIEQIGTLRNPIVGV
ncbi:fumarylacetoacetate hydrolase family protein [Dictyobacter arantiisoli]|uniref:Gentisate 1,2-dioxygenase n=1 Tax=Dictyobacter arantiisoli TaxID=2014874 RepID=A0A5A5T7M7_9CHLR|nr:fumarylacetoacetate hydrolase family protein [Dictyobacter arantiisoli]GCF07412.1 gentisate 1,2-dioxygenase [Dictyobacter arantiisoli]